MFYKIIRPIARFIVWVLNGHLHVHHKDRIPKGNYILVAPHRTWWEPILFALAASPMEFMFMAKKELFKNPILRFILVHAHALDRKSTRLNSSHVSISYAVFCLKKKISTSRHTVRRQTRLA